MKYIRENALYDLPGEQKRGDVLIDVQDFIHSIVVSTGTKSLGVFLLFMENERIRKSLMQRYSFWKKI